MTIRLFEYDAHIALDEGEGVRETLTVTFSNTAVLYLRNYKKTPDKMRYVIKTPGGSVEYDVAKLFSQLNAYFISVDSLTLFPDTELYRMDFVVSELQHVCDTVSEDEIAAVPVSSCFHSFQCGVLQGGLEAVYFLFHAELFTTVFDRPFSLQIENIFMLRKEISHLILPVKKMVWLCLGFLLRRMWKGRNNYGTD